MSTKLQALELWRHTLVASVRGDAPDLSARQMSLLLCVFMAPGPHTVRGLAKELNISKPAVSRALDRLGELGYIRRERDDLDRRNVLVQRMPEGAKFLNAFFDLFAGAEKIVSTIPDDKIPDYVLDAAAASLAEAAQPEDQATTGNWVDAAA